MKRYFLILIIIFILVLTACVKESEEPKREEIKPEWEILLEDIGNIDKGYAAYKIEIKEDSLIYIEITSDNIVDVFLFEPADFYSYENSIHEGGSFKYIVEGTQQYTKEYKRYILLPGGMVYFIVIDCTNIGDAKECKANFKIEVKAKKSEKKAKPLSYFEIKYAPFKPEEKQEISKGRFIFVAEEPKNETYKSWKIVLSELFKGVPKFLNEVFVLENDVYIKLKECGFANAYWSPANNELVICYELPDDILRTFTYAAVIEGEELNEEVIKEITMATINATIFVFFHELGHAIIDLYDIPVTGKEEDAVDQFAAILIIESGFSDAAIATAAWFYYNYDIFKKIEWWDEHSPDPERFYNIICWVYGSNPEKYSWIIKKFKELEERNCEGEYNEIRSSWLELLERYVKYKS